MGNEFFRKVIDSDKLGEVVLPDALKDKKIELIILPCENEDEKETETSKSNVKKFKGLLKDLDEDAVKYQRRIRDEC